MSEISQEKLIQIAAAAEKLVRCKGRYHSEQNYRALAALFGVTTPDLPPLEGEALRERAEPVAAGETFEEWSRRCEIQLTLCHPEFREVAEITWNACRAAMLAAPGKN